MLGNKHLFMQQDPGIMKLTVKHMSFRKDAQEYCGAGRKHLEIQRLWTPKLAGSTLSQQQGGNPIRTNAKLHLKFGNSKLFQFLFAEAMFLYNQRIPKKGYIKGILRKCLKVMRHLKAKHILPSRLLILVSSRVISRNTQTM